MFTSLSALTGTEIFTFYQTPFIRTESLAHRAGDPLCLLLHLLIIQFVLMCGFGVNGSVWIRIPVKNTKIHTK